MGGGSNAVTVLVESLISVPGVSAPVIIQGAGMGTYQHFDIVVLKSVVVQQMASLLSIEIHGDIVVGKQVAIQEYDVLGVDRGVCYHPHGAVDNLVLLHHYLGAVLYGEGRTGDVAQLPDVVALEQELVGIDYGNAAGVPADPVVHYFIVG